MAASEILNIILQKRQKIILAEKQILNEILQQSNKMFAVFLE